MSYKIHCLVRRLEGACLHDNIQTSYWMCFRITKSSKNSQTKIRYFTFRLPNFFALSWNNSSFPIASFWMINHVQLTQLVFLTHAPLWSLHRAQSLLEPKLLTKCSHWDFAQNSAPPLFVNTSFITTPPFERVHEHKCCIIYHITQPMSILW